PGSRMPDDVSHNIGGPAERNRGIRPRAEIPQPAAKSAHAPPPPETALMAAREAARTAQTLDELQALLAAFEGCGLRAPATQLVFADGNPQRRGVVVGGAPGFDEGGVGRPVVGRSGQLS